MYSYNTDERTCYRLLVANRSKEINGLLDLKFVVEYVGAVFRGRADRHDEHGQVFPYITKYLPHYAILVCKLPRGR